MNNHENLRTHILAKTSLRHNRSPNMHSLRTSNTNNLQHKLHIQHLHERSFNGTCHLPTIILRNKIQIHKQSRKTTKTHNNRNRHVLHFMASLLGFTIHNNRKSTLT